MIAIDLSKRFRPRAEAGLLSRLHQEAWQARVDALRAQEAESHVGEIVAAHLEGRFPLRDMEILAKYGHAEKRTRITVYCHNPDAPDYPKNGSNTWRAKGRSRRRGCLKPLKATLMRCASRFTNSVKNIGLFANGRLRRKPKPAIIRRGARFASAFP
jgi:RNA:NAD 2'-phosphotransferase (TPT1/KptA family)